ncbi:MAG: hypothetical protein ABIR17_04570 [Pseudolysinimonas sp.]|uniref:hypothetical protein n=1 Tax=Pseudolysinimonas sp. TaxID=2680009 RepID=UPI0032658038
MLSTVLRVLVRCWPALLAWFLVGWTVRALIIRGGSYLLNISYDLGDLVLPLAILAQLAAYVGMFFAIKRELRHVSQADDVQAGESAVSAARQWRESLLASILPFFLLYLAWNLNVADRTDLYAASLTQGNFGSDSRVESVTWFVLGFAVLAFVARWLLGRFSARLPRWSTLLATYLEAVWVFIALSWIQHGLGILGSWLSTRRMFGGIVDAWAELRANFAWLGAIGDAIGWTWAQIGTLVGLPLAWLAFASIIYFGTMPRSPRPDSSVARVASERWNRMPVWLQRVGSTASAGILDRWRPVTLAARLIWRSGPIAMGTYLLAFAVITAASEWLSMLIFRLLGPHEVAWWYGASDAVNLGVSAVLAVLQVCVVAAAFDHALRSDAAEQGALEEIVEEAGDAVSAAAAPAGTPPST